MKKYYLVFTWYSAYNSEWKPQTFVCKEHPFTVVNEYNKMQGYTTRISNFQEITKEEFDLYESLELLAN